jgi:AcrR family transcriptional regulator
VRGGLAPRAVPISRSKSELFDDLVLDAVEELEDRWAAELAQVEFAVEDVPPAIERAAPDFDPEVIVDRGIPLGRLYRNGVAGIQRPVVVIYRRPVEARAVERDDRGDLVFMVVAELVAELLGRDIDEIDPPRP